MSITTIEPIIFLLNMTRANSYHEQTISLPAQAITTEIPVLTGYDYDTGLTVGETDDVITTANPDLTGFTTGYPLDADFLANETQHVEEEEIDNVIIILSKISSFVMNVFAPVACAIGITGCAMGLILLSSTSPLRRLASCHYLYALAISSIVYLACLGLFWIEAVFALPLYSYHQIGCKSFIYMLHVADFVTAWLIVLIAADRVLIIHQPGFWQRMRNNVDLTKKRNFIKRIIFLVVSVACIFESWIFVVAYLNQPGPEDPPDTPAMCTIHPEHLETYALFIRIECVSVLVIPTVITTVFTGAAIYGYRKLCSDVSVTVRFRTNASVIIEDEQMGTTEHQVTYTFNTTNTRSSFQTCDLTSSPVSSRDDMIARRLKTTERQVTKTLLMLTTMFVLLNLPHNSIRFYRTFQTSMTEVEQEVWFICLDVFAWLLYYFYYATLFYFYIFWSPKMRSRLVPTAWKLLECYCMNPQSHFYD